MNIIFRVDASVNIGTGHVVRCLTLADELRSKGADVRFICREDNGNLIDFIKKKNYEVYPLPAGIDSYKDLKLTEEILKEQDKMPEVLIVDHYGIDVKWESPIRKVVKKIMVIDDLANRRHDCALLLDQNYSLNADRYKGLVPDNCAKLLGPKYALLRPQFQKARENLQERNGEVKRILVFFGGADPTNETCKALRAIKMLDRPDIATDVVIGSCNPHRAEIEAIASHMSNTFCHFDVENMAELMAHADLCLGASGSTTWERCCLGLPSIVMILADNQKDIAEELEKEGVIVNLGWHKKVKEEAIAEAILELIKNPEKAKAMSAKGMNTVDGYGAGKVIDAMDKTAIGNKNLKKKLKRAIA
ncbi:MAG TPA: UDP-2,4-diacetamido-2,4,6-trideoxy-beta-L-altropyranose hydrolase [Nitrospiraceae bacterium]|nr:UDP-2,4-diacetamido-2,4,6-trideoxy-beta-L-altropyranose hydrolase [Nitrospiraceae bacterium]